MSTQNRKTDDSLSFNAIVSHRFMRHQAFTSVCVLVEDRKVNVVQDAGINSNRCVNSEVAPVSILKIFHETTVVLSPE